MGADIWVGRPGEGALGHFRDSYGRDITLNAIGLSYWFDIAPRLVGGDEYPLELNSDLSELIRQSAAVRLDGPNALDYARHYLTEAQIPEADPEQMIALWRTHIDELLALIDLSTRTGKPLIMSL